MVHVVVVAARAPTASLRDGYATPAPAPAPEAGNELRSIDTHSRHIVRTMVHDDAQTVLDRMHAVLGAYYAGHADEASVRALFTDGIAWHVPGDNVIAGHYHGAGEVLGYLTRRRDHAAGTFKMHPRDTLTGTGDHIGVLTDGTATINTGQRWASTGSRATA